MKFLKIYIFTVLIIFFRVANAYDEAAAKIAVVDVESILENGHDWAQDHIAESKNNLDQVFDFLMNETKKDGMELSMSIDDKDMAMMEGRKKTGTPLCARGIASAKATYDVYPSAYANGHAIQVCKGKMKGLDGETHCSGAYC